MKKFLIHVLFKVATSLVSLAILVVIVFALVTALIFLATDKNVAEIEENTILVFDLDVSLNDSPGAVGMGLWLGRLLGDGGVSQIALNETLEGLKSAAEDERISALVLKGSLVSENYGSGYASLCELRGAIHEFQKSGKRVYAYVQTPEIKDYYLLSGVDEVHMNPSGFLTWNGLAIEGVFLSDLLDKNGVNMHVFEAGRFKGAADMFKRRGFSDENRQQLQRFIDQRWEEIVETVSVERNISKAQLSALSQEEGLLNPQQALKRGFIDSVSHYDEFLEALEQDHPGFSQILLSDYLETLPPQPVEFGKKKGVIGVVYMEGDVMTGESVYPVVGGDTYSRAIREFRKDPSIKAVVLRINSPGGAAYAGEQIAREVELTRQEKPVVVSLGAIAASAGYMIAAPANMILTEPTTLTGSIGAFMMFPDAEQLGKNYGVYSESVSTGPLASLTSFLKTPNEQEQQLYQRFLDEVYQQFLTIVETGRGFSREQLDLLAEGRIWTGREAVENGLADKLGGLKDAIQEAKVLAGIHEEGLKLIEFPSKMTGMDWLEELFSDSRIEPLTMFEGQVFKRTLPRELHQTLETFSLFLKDHQNRKVYSRLPFILQ